tara:strand:+ start:912 stop:1373 length:462 start_codon:yes stop_codon:yes gene_type:complete
MLLQLKNERPLQHEYWMLPRVPYKAKLWMRIPRLSQYIPFGYEVDPEDEDWLNPIPTELELIELARKHVKQYSLRQVAAWLTTQSGKSISHYGLKKRLDVERKRKRITSIKRQYAKRLEKALRQIEILEKERTGAYTHEGDNDTASTSQAPRV